MDVEKGFKEGEIGGPMNLGEGYRWNIPVITYGFDRPFRDYFGTNGIAAVEAAIDILNQLPPASQIKLQDYPLEVFRVNYTAQAEVLMDLKTHALALLLEQMGLADSKRYMFCVRDFWRWNTNFYFEIIQRNFDPATSQPTNQVNGVSYWYQFYHGQEPVVTNVFCEATPYSIDPNAPYSSALTSFLDLGTPWGYLAGKLTRDDVGGLRYLLSGTKIRCESLLADIHLADTNSGSLVVVADRPGVEKITFLRHPSGRLNGQFLPFTNRWTDVYLDFDFPGYQEVERVTTRPDILFTAEDPRSLGWVTTTGTTNWVNNASLNGEGNAAGPGVIRPPITISFSSLGPARTVSDQSGEYVQGQWGSFDSSTNLPIIYPATQLPFESTELHLSLLVGERIHEFHWPLVGPAYGRFAFQTGTNLTDWTTLLTITNSGADFDFQVRGATNGSMQFFRTVPQL
jgi:hypothetical protein